MSPLTPSYHLETLSEPSSSYAALISQTTAIIPSFTLESGTTLERVPVAYKTWGRLNDARDNVMVICHALTGSADVADWWGPLLGPGRAFDPTRYFIYCGNVIGSPYGTVSSVTVHPGTGRRYGPEMPGSCVKDDVRLHKLVLDSLGVRQVAVVIGGSMGGMTTLEWPLNTPPGYVRHIVPLATSARYSAWGISWGEAQRQSIYSDPAYEDGYYCHEKEGEGPDDAQPLEERRRRMEARQPTRGLAAARMAALLTYRSRDSFESRFGRKAGLGPKRSASSASIPGVNGSTANGAANGAHSPATPSTPQEDAWKAHNDGHRGRRASPSAPTSGASSPRGSVSNSLAGSTTLPPLPTVLDGATAAGIPLTNLELSMPRGPSETLVDAFEAGKLGGGPRTPQVFSAQSYLRYQGDKFTSRYDANCYIHITRKLDTHDISQPSSHSDPPTLSSQLPHPPENPTDEECTAALQHALSLLPPALVIGIETDGLFTPREQREIAQGIPDAELVIISSPNGHDGFLLEFEAISGHVGGWLRRRLPEIYEREPLVQAGEEGTGAGQDEGKESLFGEAEADITRW